MKYVYPSYYKEFSCIADRCRHSCCIGWEIDIDEKTLDIYHSLKGNIGKKLSENIEVTNENAHFRLSEDERCPFLKRNGLCEIILELGEDHICSICKDHPRFRNFFKDREETGLGLVCEEAARIILTDKEPFSIIFEDDGEVCDGDNSELEKEILDRREEFFRVLSDSSISAAERIERLIKENSLYMTERSLSDWAKLLMSLERLDAKWTDLLSLISFEKRSAVYPIGYDREMINLLCYFIYRHIADAKDGIEIYERLAFCVLSTRIISAIFVKLSELQSVDETDFIDIARIYSGEIEYSCENTDALLSELSEY